MNIPDFINAILSADDDSFDTLYFNTPIGDYFITIGPAIIEDGFYGFIGKSADNEALEPDSTLLIHAATMAEARETAETFKELFEKFPPAGITSPNGNFYKFKT